jgi:hypothetical protein
MMDEQRLERLADLARRERVPQVDVADRVMLRLQTSAPAPAARAFVWAASLGLAIAVPLVISAPLVLRTWGDPLVRMFVDASRGLP